MVKPQRAVVDYTGQVIANQYSTVWTGNYQGGSEGSGRHTGADINEGLCQTTEIRAVAEGTILRVIDNWLEQNPTLSACGGNSGQQMIGTWGNYVIVQHDDIPNREGYSGRAYSIYAHLASVDNRVSAGDKVLRGTLIGFQGSTGNSSGPHLHFQMDKDKGENIRSHPYALGPADDPYTPAVAEWTFNPMRFVQAHIVRTTFASSGACTEYFAGMPGPTSCEDYEPEIDHEWFEASPVGYPINNFAARWEGTITLPPGRNWIFYATVDDGVRLWVNNNLLIDEWHLQSLNTPYTYSAVAAIGPGTHQVKMEYYESSNGAVAQLAWQLALNNYLPLILKQPTPTPTFTSTPTRTFTPTRTRTPSPTRTSCPYPAGDPRCQ
jgi:hypothetical protein